MNFKSITHDFLISYLKTVIKIKTQFLALLSVQILFFIKLNQLQNFSAFGYVFTTVHKFKPCI